MKIKTNLLILLCILASMQSAGQADTSRIITTDIQNFWTAYDKIISAKDSAQQYDHLQQYYLDKATPGLKDLIEVRRYTKKDYIDAINRYPKFWASLRKNTANVEDHFEKIRAGISKLKELYPDLKPATIYFSIGAFRTNGTIKGAHVLIGSEMALGDSATVTDELPEHLRSFYTVYKPRENIALLCTHEYIHTQQKPMEQNLLSMCLYEGIAEFFSCLATGRPSNTPAISYGDSNRVKVVYKFVDDLFLMSNNNNWMWGENRNEFKVRDLGYFIGYDVARKNYKYSEDKLWTTKELIELDYTNERRLVNVVDRIGWLRESFAELYDDYEEKRPVVQSISPFKDRNTNIKPGLLTIALTFSEPMDTTYRGFDYGPMGENYIYKFVRVIGWSADKKTFTYEVEVLPGRRYQFMITNSFRNREGIRLKPKVVEFSTGR